MGNGIRFRSRFRHRAREGVSGIHAHSVISVSAVPEPGSVVLVLTALGVFEVLCGARQKACTRT